jgi:hypothetical protein
MEAMIGISLDSYLYLKLAKMLCLLIISCVFSSTKSENKGAEQVVPRRGSGGGRVCGVAQIMCTHVSKCKNDKTK